MKRIILIFLFLFIQSKAFSQPDWNIVKEATNLPLVNNPGTVKGYPFNRFLYISKDSLKNGFEISLWDPTYKIVFFRLAYDCEWCDIWVKTIYGNKVTLKDAPILKNIKKGEILDFVLFKVGKNNKNYTIPDFTIVITD